MACTIALARDGLQRSLARSFQVLRVATARSPRVRMRAWALFTAFCRADSFGRSSRHRWTTLMTTNGQHGSPLSMNCSHNAASNDGSSACSRHVRTSDRDLRVPLSSLGCR